MSVMLSQFNRVVFLSSFDPNDDIYISINIPNIDYNILGENLDDTSPNNLFLRTNLDQNLTLDVDDFNFYRDGLVFFILDGNQDIDTLMSHGSAGNGLGVLSPYGTGAANMSGLFSSIAIDLSGGYCLSGEFIDVNTGLTARSPKSITARISSDSLDTEFEYLTTKVLDESELFNFNVENKDIRIRISNNLTLYEVDFRNNVFDNYTNVFKFDTNRDPSKIPLNVKFGIAYSGALRLPIKDVTFSGTLTSNDHSHVNTNLVINEIESDNTDAQSTTTTTTTTPPPLPSTTTTTTTTPPPLPSTTTTTTTTPPLPSTTTTTTTTPPLPSSQMLRILFLGGEPFGVRSQDTSELITEATYESNPAYVDGLIDSDLYDMIVFDNIHRADSNSFTLNVTTYNKLKDYVTRGGTVFDFNEHYYHTLYSYLPGSQYIDGLFAGFSSESPGAVSNLVYDLGGISNPDPDNTGSMTWKGTSLYSEQNSFFTTEAINIGIGSDTSIRTNYSQVIKNAQSNGLPILTDGADTTESIIHMWNGSMPASGGTRPGHLNQGVFGKIIISGDTYSNSFTSFQSAIYQILDYIAQQKVDYTIGINVGGTPDAGTGVYNLGGTDRNGKVNGPSEQLAFNVGDRVRIQWVYGYPDRVSAHPLYIKTVQGTGTGNQASDVTGAGTATIEWTPETAGTYYYQCSNHNNMHGIIIVT